jgi:diaminohydroxyphosphoribosylaminopyrimidine deaminase/5-amino-6-(5-phosphoribosylamino)uracil reductase
MILTDEILMKRCFQLAELGEGNVAPNPKVGALLVYENQIIAEGYHQEYGKAHAEVNCIAACPQHLSHLISISTLYVSLEPCSHFGKTGPCSHLIVEKGIKKVIVGSRDFNPVVNGNGIAYLKENGVEVVEMNWNEKQKELNPQFFINQVYKRPYIIAKYAQSADGFISKKNESVKITSSSVDVLSHKIRSQVDAVLIGKNTFGIDKPLLNVRLVEGKNPDRIVLDSNLENDYSSWASDSQKTIILNQKKESNFQSLYYTRVSIINDINEVLERLFSLGYFSILVEGGSQLIQSFLDKNLVDNLIIYTNKNLKITEGVSSPKLDESKFKLTKQQIVESIEINIYKSCNI